MNSDKKKYHVLVLSDGDKTRLQDIANKAMCAIETAQNLQERTFILRILIESFEETHNCVVPFKNRYTEPAWNYHKKGSE